MTGDKLKGKRVAIIAADQVEEIELVEPRRALEDAGAETELISIESGEIQGVSHFENASKHRVDRTVADADPDDYDALLIPAASEARICCAPTRARRVRARVRRRRQAAGGDLPRPVAARRGRRRAGPDGHVVAVAPDRHPQRGRRVGRQRGRRRRRHRHEPEARRHPGLQREDDRGVRRGQARRPARAGRHRTLIAAATARSSVCGRAAALPESRAVRRRAPTRPRPGRAPPPERGRWRSRRSRCRPRRRPRPTGRAIGAPAVSSTRAEVSTCRPPMVCVIAAATRTAAAAPRRRGERQAVERHPRLGRRRLDELAHRPLAHALFERPLVEQVVRPRTGPARDRLDDVRLRPRHVGRAEELLARCRRCARAGRRAARRRRSRPRPTRRRACAAVELVHARGQRCAAREPVLEPAAGRPRIAAQAQRRRRPDESRDEIGAKPRSRRSPARSASPPSAASAVARRRLRPAARRRSASLEPARIEADAGRERVPRSPPRRPARRATAARRSRRRAAPRRAAAAPDRRPGTPAGSPRSSRGARRRPTRAASTRPPRVPRSKHDRVGAQLGRAHRGARARPCRRLRRRAGFARSGERERRLVLDVLEADPVGPVTNTAYVFGASTTCSISMPRSSASRRWSSADSTRRPRWLSSGALAASGSPLTNMTRAPPTSTAPSGAAAAAVALEGGRGRAPGCGATSARWSRSNSISVGFSTSCTQRPSPSSRDVPLPGGSSARAARGSRRAAPRGSTTPRSRGPVGVEERELAAPRIARRRA